MNKTDLKNMVIGVIIGISGTLLLTLQLWGHEWYKMVASAITGVIIGMFIADYKLTIQIFRQSFLQSFGRLGRYVWQEHPIFLAHSFVNIIFVLTPAALMWLFLFYTPQIMGQPLLLILIVIPQCWLITGMDSIGYKAWDKLSADRKKRFWGEEGKLAYQTFRQEGGDCQIYLDSDYYKKRIGERKVAKAMIYSSLISFPSAFWRNIIYMPKGLAKIVILIAKILFTIIIFVGTFAVTLPFWVIKEISKSGKMVTVCLGIVAGGIVGTLCHSYFTGIGIGLLVLILGYLFQKIEEVDMIYFCQDGRLLNRLWS